MTNHEAQSESKPEFSQKEKSLLDINKLSEWRTRQYGVLDGLMQADNFANKHYSQDFDEAKENLLDDYLKEQGIDESSVSYQTVRNLYSDARIGRGDGDGISNSEWGNSPASRGVDADDHKSQRTKFEERIAELMPATSDDGSSINESQSSETLNIRTSEEWIEYAKDFEEYASLLTGVEVSREKWAIVSAKRQGRAIGGKGKKHDDAQDEYHKNVQQLGIMQLENKINDSDSDDEKNSIVIKYLFNEQAKLRDLTIDKLKKTKTSKMIDWFNKRHFATKIAIGIGVGAAAGFGGALIAGAVSAAGVGAATAGIASGATRFFRGMAMKEKDQRGMKTAKQKFEDPNNPVTFDDLVKKPESLAERVEAAATVYEQTFEEDTKREQKKRKKAIAWGLGMVAAGGLVGYGVHELVNAGQGLHLFGNHDHTPTKSTPDTTPNADNRAGVNGNEAAEPKGYELSSFSDSARYVHPGEGWYETFQDMGIPESHWEDVLNDVGPKLHEQGLAYWDSSVSEWRISRSGNLSLDALKTIAAGSNRDGFTLAA